MAYHLWRRRYKPGATPMALMMLAVSAISLGYVLQFTNTTLSGQILATNIQYFGIVTLPVLWFVFSLEYTDYDKWLTRRNLFLLAIVPFTTLVLAWTNGIDGLMWYGRHLEFSEPFTIIAKTYGPWFWIHTSYSYLLLLFGMFLLLRRLFRPPRLYREQAIALLICVIVPLVWNVVYIFRLIPILRVDLSPSAFVISGLAIAWGLFQLRFFDIIPLARGTLIENMSDGIIVLDTQNCIVDLNRIAERIINYPISEAIGQSADHALSTQPELVELLYSPTNKPSEVVIGTAGTQRYYQANISTLYNQRNHIRGRLVILHDVTEHQLIEARRKELEDRAHLLSRLSTMGKMAAGIAHETINPLTSVIGYAESLLAHDIPDEIKGDLEVINRGAKSAADILERLLTFAGQHHVERDYVDINRILEITIELRNHSLSSNNIEVIKQFDRDLPKTMANSGQLQEVFLNLIINAETSMMESHGGGKLIINT